MPKWEDYYEILGVKPDASREEIKKAYRENVFIYHPDRMQGLSESVRHRAEEKMKKVIQAYEVLSDPQKRQQYHSEWLREKGGTTTPQGTYKIPKPKPVVDPPFIHFDDVPAKTVKTSSFIIRNEGGPYSTIWFDDPKSWVKVTNYTSLTDSDELPLRVEIKAEGEDWGKTYLEIIRVRLDNEETQVKIQLRTKAKTARKRSYAKKVPYTQQSTYAGPIPQAHVGPVPQPPPSPQPTPVSSPVVPRIAVLGKWTFGLIVLGIIGILIATGLDGLLGGLEKKRTREPRDMYKRYFFNKTEGLAFSDKAIFKTSDGGKNWENLLIIRKEWGGFRLEVDSLKIINNQRIIVYLSGYRTGNVSYIEPFDTIETSDSGEIWEHCSYGYPKADLCTPVGHFRRYVTSRSYDGGKTWQAVTPYDERLVKDQEYDEILRRGLRLINLR